MEGCCGCCNLSQVVPVYPSWHWSHDTCPEASSTQVGLKLSSSSPRTSHHEQNLCSWLHDKRESEAWFQPVGRAGQRTGTRLTVIGCPLCGVTIETGKTVLTVRTAGVVCTTLKSRYDVTDSDHNSNTSGFWPQTHQTSSACVTLRGVVVTLALHAVPSKQNPAHSVET